MSAGPSPPHERSLPVSVETWRRFLLGQLPAEQHAELSALIERGEVDLVTADGDNDITDPLIVALRSPTSVEGPPGSAKYVDRAIAQVLSELPAITAPAEPLPLPCEQLGEYRLLRPLGRGGMGAVYLAEHVRLRRPCAIKLLSATTASHPDAAARFEREMRAIGQLDHPHIVRATDAGEADGRLYLVMEYVDGCNLHQHVRDAGPLSVRTALRAIRDAAVGLEFAHRQGVIHRDIKPGNLIRDRQGRVKVLDLGLARMRAAEDSPADREASQRLTHDGAVMGTIDYMAPEQAADTKDADERSDVYSLGCTLYFLLTGAPPYPQGTVVQRIVAHRQAPIPRVSERRADVPAELDDLLARWLAKRPEDRPRSMSGAIAELDGLLHLPGLADDGPLLVDPGSTPVAAASLSTATHHPLTAPVPRPMSVREPAGEKRRSLHPLVVGVGLAVIIVAGVMLSLVVLLQDEQPWGRDMTVTSSSNAGMIAAPTVGPPRPSPKARPLTFDADGRVDLLRWLDLTTDVDKGDVRFEHRTLHVGSNARVSVRTTNPLPEAVRLHFELHRVPDTDGAFRLVVQHQQAVFGVILDSPGEVPGHRVCGLNPFPRDGLFQQRDVPHSGPLIPFDSPVTMHIDLLPDGLKVTIDGTTVYEWTGRFGDLTGKLPPENFPALLLDTWADAEQFLIHRAELIDLSRERSSNSEAMP
jgi:serine/threonine protein kinase